MHALTQMLLAEVTKLRIEAAKKSVFDFGIIKNCRKSTRRGGTSPKINEMTQGDDSATVRAKLSELETTVVHLLDRVDKVCFLGLSNKMKKF